MIETTVITFEVNNSFDEWVKIFDGPEAIEMHAEFEIHPIYRGCEKGNRQKVVVIHQAEVGQIEKFVAKNGEKFISHGLIPQTIKTSTFVAS